MADGMTVDVQGANTLISALGALDVMTQVRAMAAIVDAANACADDARSTVPFDDSNTDANHEHLRDTEYVHFEELGAEVGFDSDHAVYVELGTYKMAAQPYLLPAFELAVQQLLGELTSLF